MKLIAESGSTRTEWALVEDNHLIQRVFTEGLYPFFEAEVGKRENAVAVG